VKQWNRKTRLQGRRLLFERIPPEDRPWVRQWVQLLVAYANQLLNTRTGLIFWGLDRES
jgi:hypothetical protein